jgi:hypothetical protein
VKNNLVLIAVIGACLVATIGLVVWTTMLYMQMHQYIAETGQLRESIGALIKKTPAPVQGNIPLLEADRKLYNRSARQLRLAFGHPLRSALEAFISVVRTTKGEKITLNDFKKDLLAEWNKSESYAQKELNYKSFQRNFPNWTNAMRAFRTAAEKATAEPISDDNINEIFQSALGIPRRLGGKLDNLQRLMNNYRNGLLEMTKGKIMFDSEEATHFSFAAPLAAASTMQGGESSEDPTADYPVIAQHWEILSDIVRRSCDSGIHSFTSFRRRSIQPEKVGGFDVFHYSIGLTGTMESIRKLVGILDQAISDNRVYVVRSIFLYRLEDSARTLLMPEALVTDKPNIDVDVSATRPGGRRNGRRRSESESTQPSEEQRKAQELARRQAEELAQREKSLPYYHRSGYGEPVIGRSDICRAVIDVEYVMESGDGN